MTLRIFILLIVFIASNIAAEFSNYAFQGGLSFGSKMLSDAGQVVLETETPGGYLSSPSGYSAEFGMTGEDNLGFSTGFSYTKISCKNGTWTSPDYGTTVNVNWSISELNLYANGLFGTFGRRQKISLVSFNFYIGAGACFIIPFMSASGSFEDVTRTGESRLETKITYNALCGMQILGESGFGGYADLSYNGIQSLVFRCGFTIAWGNKSTI